MNNINYTFIVPHKNCPQLLNRCIDSIPVREDVQIIIVDDNSEVDKKPSFDRKGVEVVLLDADHSKGAGRARNVGLQHAEGKWLLFADADDYYTDFLPTLLDKYADDEITDIVYLNACKFDENGNITSFKTNKLITNYLNNLEGAEMDLRYDLWTPWSRMVKKSIVDINNILFDELPAGNDVMFGLKSSKFSKKIQVEEKIIYKYYKPSKGSCTDAARKQMFESRLALRCDIIKFNKDVGYRLKENLFEIIDMFLQSKECSIMEGVNTYRKYLRMCNVSMITDLCQFIIRNKKICVKHWYRYIVLIFYLIFSPLVQITSNK